MKTIKMLCSFRNNCNGQICEYDDATADMLIKRRAAVLYIAPSVQNDAIDTIEAVAVDTQPLIKNTFRKRGRHAKNK